MEKIRVINSNGNGKAKVKHVTIAVAENAAPRLGYEVDDPNYEVVNGKVVKKEIPDVVKAATDSGTENPKPPTSEESVDGGTENPKPPTKDESVDGGTENPKPPTKDESVDGGTENPKPPTKDEIFAKYIPDYLGEKPHWMSVVKVIGEATIEEAEIIIQSEKSKAILKAFEQKKQS